MSLMAVCLIEIMLQKWDCQWTLNHQSHWIQFHTVEATFCCHRHGVAVNASCAMRSSRAFRNRVSTRVNHRTIDLSTYQRAQTKFHTWFFIANTWVTGVVNAFKAEWPIRLNEKKKIDPVDGFKKFYCSYSFGFVCGTRNRNVYVTLNLSEQIIFSCRRMITIFKTVNYNKLVIHTWPAKGEL